ncbi:uncharacterized protein LOC129565115 [Sitodiplosis mosellana]|uniref:uncharacterized protein LOC129565115 n=1 Tax=Sitodiplosis mosellana TaxID=263140 RepID=UPI0024439A39|nr:uncharacterized protein LOC129565115 [Sitodiplosis mosellana]
MSLVKHLVRCVCFLLVFSCIEAEEITKIEKKTDDGIQTYVVEPIDNVEQQEAQQEVTTLYPPLIEEDQPSLNVPQVVDSILPNVDVNSNPENGIKIPDGPVDQYANGLYYPPQNQYSPYQNPQYQPYQYTTYPWQYGVQQYQPQLPSNAGQPNMQYMATVQQPNTQMFTPQTNQPSYVSSPYAEFEGVLVPLQTLMPPPPSSPQGQSPQTEKTNSNKEIRPTTKTAAARTNYDLAILLQSLFPPNILQTVLTMINFTLNSFSMMAFAAAITSAICSVTPLCTLTFGALPISLQRKLGEEDGTTMQRVRRAAVQVTGAIDKYERFQKNIGSIAQILSRGRSV